jgi:hypothetical protein
MTIPLGQTRTGLLIACLVTAAIVVAVGVAVGAIGSGPHEWPWYLAILGSALAVLGLWTVPRPLAWSTQALLTLVAATTLWMYFAGVLVDLADSNDTLGLAPDALGVFGAGMIVFFGLLIVGGGISDTVMRHAVGAAFVVVFFGLLATGAFHEEWKHSVIGDKLVDNLTTLFGVVVAFYFGSTGAVEYLKHRENEITKRVRKVP